MPTTKIQLRSKMLQSIVARLATNKLQNSILACLLLDELKEKTDC